MRESWLKARWATGPGTQFTDDKDDPFADLRVNPNLNIGSYGIHVDAQHDTLAKIVEAKAFAKAVKADDAEVPVYLWNNRIKTPSSITEAQRDKALDILRELGHMALEMPTLGLPGLHSWHTRHQMDTAPAYQRWARHQVWTGSQSDSRDLVALVTHQLV